jgi:hypothetical protein
VLTQVTPGSSRRRAKSGRSAATAAVEGRELGALDAQRRQELDLTVDRLDRRQRLAHPAEHDARALPLERHRHDAHPRLQPDLAELKRRAKDERRPERRMARERDLCGRREDPHARVRVRAGRVDEDRLGELQLARERLERVLGDVARVGEDRELVALERSVREHVADDVAEAGHDQNLPTAPGANPEVMATASRRPAS